ncbi:hypothetical protein ACFVUH_34495 [Kitasatospora sp. NPDC058032]|uniref:hypothetical protein n=1 Tax=Kitasatospora sp. NPDC058032 TaxID=3346307 RepID=UPI0036DF4EA0
MIVTVTATTLLAVIAALLIRGRRVSLPTALVLWLSGFTLASTGLAGPVNTFLSSVIRLVSGH